MDQSRKINEIEAPNEFSMTEKSLSANQIGIVRTSSNKGLLFLIFVIIFILVGFVFLFIKSQSSKINTEKESVQTPSALPTDKPTPTKILDTPAPTPKNEYEKQIQEIEIPNIEKDIEGIEKVAEKL